MTLQKNMKKQYCSAEICRKKQFSMCKCTTQILQEAENLFNKYKDGNNVITAVSLIKVMDKVVDARAKAIMKKADRDNNGQIDKKGM